MSDGKEAKFLFIDDLSQTPSENTNINNEAINEWWQRGQLFIHGDNEPEAVINTKGKSTVDIEGLKKYFEEMVRKESGNET